MDKKVFRYNFSILKNEIHTENLLEVLASGSEKRYLTRERQNIEVFADFRSSKDVAEVKTRKETLFLPAASQWNNKLAMKIVEGFSDINIISGPESESYRKYTMKLLKGDEEKKKKILDFLKRADFCIENGVVEKIQIPEFVKKQIPVGIKGVPDEIDTVYFAHNLFDINNNIVDTVKFNIEDESVGTQKFFNVLGPIVDTIENGKSLFIDEFDNSLHPYLTKFIIDLFESNNDKNAQLIVTTHDTSLLSHKDLNKEQFWFTEKDRLGVGNLFSLAEFKDERNDVEFSKKYLEGRFGALPFVDFKKY